MKKVMFAAALAATGMTFAAKPVAQVYDVTLSIKSTAAYAATVNNKQNPFVDTAEKQDIVYRKQTSYTWKGLIWGCGCETIDGVWELVENTCEDGVQVADTVKGCVIWDNKTKEIRFMGNGSDLTDPESVQDNGFGWEFIHAINKDGKQVEGVWEMTQLGLGCEERADTIFNFKGAGFGTASIATEVVGVDVDAKGKDVDLIGPTCLSYIKNINGNFAGSMRQPLLKGETGWSGCTFCGFKPSEETCDYASAWDWCKWDAECDCAAKIDENLDLTAAYGTWKVSYNSSLSSKLGKTVKSEKDFILSIRQVYKFPENVATAIETVETIIAEYVPQGIMRTCFSLSRNGLFGKLAH